MKDIRIFSILFVFAILCSVTLHARPVPLSKQEPRSALTSSVYAVTDADFAFLNAVFEPAPVTETNSSLYIGSNRSILGPKRMAEANYVAEIRYKRSKFAGLSKLFARSNNRTKRTAITRFYGSRYKLRSMPCRELNN